MKGEAAALSVHAQRCQSHYFSTTPRTVKENTEALAVASKETGLEVNASKSKCLAMS